jgi:hypothetical protein
MLVVKGNCIFRVDGSGSPGLRLGKERVREDWSEVQVSASKKNTRLKAVLPTRLKAVLPIPSTSTLPYNGSVHLSLYLIYSPSKSYSLVTFGPPLSFSLFTIPNSLFQNGQIQML